MTPIERHTETLLQEFGATNAPIPVDRIAKSLGATIRYEPYDNSEGDDISGILFREGGKVIIGVNASHSEVRQRFTIAHEIGHLRLHTGDLFVDGAARPLRRDQRASQAIDRREISANQFAAALLMPKKLLSTNLKSVRLVPLSLVHSLAEEFEVSAEAMAFRLKNLRYDIDA